MRGKAKEKDAEVEKARKSLAEVQKNVMKMEKNIRRKERDVEEKVSRPLKRKGENFRFSLVCSRS